MVYLLFGNQTYMIRKQRNKILSDFFNEQEENVVIFDSSEGQTLNDVLDECFQPFLTDNLKAIIFKNSKELFDEKNQNSKLFQKFEAFVNLNAKDVILIFEIYEKVIKDQNKFVKLINEKGKIIQMSEITKKDWPLYIRKYFESKKVRISEDALAEIQVRAGGGDLYYFYNEVDKLLLYKQSNITYEDVCAIMTPSIESDVFSVLNSLIYGRKDRALKSLLDLINNNNDAVSLLSLIGTSLIFMDEVALLQKEGMNQSQIASELNANPYRVSSNLKSLNRIDHKKIVEKLNELYNLDKKIKHNDINALFGIEIFVLTF